MKNRWNKHLSTLEVQNEFKNVSLLEEIVQSGIPKGCYLLVRQDLNLRQWRIQGNSKCWPLFMHPCVQPQAHIFWTVVLYHSGWGTLYLITQFSLEDDNLRHETTAFGCVTPKCMQILRIGEQRTTLNQQSLRHVLILSWYTIASGESMSFWSWLCLWTVTKVLVRLGSGNKTKLISH